MIEKTYRSYQFLEVRSADGGEDQGIFSGYASTYQTDAYGDKIVPGAFAQSLVDKRGKYPIMLSHDTSQPPIGFTTSIAEDAKGLHVEAALALRTSGGRDSFELLKAAKAADYRMGLSIGFITNEWEMDGDIRLLKSIDLWEISLTPFPANRGSRVDETRSVRHPQRDYRSVLAAIFDERLALAKRT